MIEEGGMKEKGIFLALLLMVLASFVASGCVKAEDVTCPPRIGLVLVLD